MGARRYGIYLRAVHIDIVRVSAANKWDIECEREKINLIPPSVHVLFCLLYEHTNNYVFDDFPKISDHFPKISEDFPKFFRRLGERLRTFSEHFPKIAESCRRFPRTYRWFSIIQHHLWVLLKRLYSYSNGNLKTCDNNLIYLHVKISYFYAWKYMDFLGGRNP